MKIKIKTETHEVPIDELSEKSVRCLIEKIEVIGKCKNRVVSVFLGATKLNIEQSLNDAGVTDNSTVLVLLRKEEAPESGKVGSSASHKATNPNNPFRAPNQNQQAPPLQQPNPNFSAGNIQGMMAGLNPEMMGKINPEIIQAFIKDPSFIDNIINSINPYGSESEKQMLKKTIESMSNMNPESFNNFLSSFPMKDMKIPGGMMGGVNSPYYTAPQQQQQPQTPMGYNPPMNYHQSQQGSQMGSPMMPYMMNPFAPNMYNNNPYMQQQPMYSPPMPQQPTQGYNIPPTAASPPPPGSGACSHGYYSPSLIFKKQLAKLEELGFKDKDKNVNLLLKHSGDLDAAVSEMFDNQDKNGNSK